MRDRVRITTGARLHFGLLDIAAPFGGCGVMIDSPQTIITACEAGEFSFTAAASNPEYGVRDHDPDDRQQRATAIAQRIADATGDSGNLPPVHVQVIQSAPSHTGLGSGTQLSLAIAEAILRVSPTTRSPKFVSDLFASDLFASELFSSDLLSIPEQLRELWLQAAQRGKRSAVGTHGYLTGGFIAEGLLPAPGHQPLNTLDMHLEMPPAWRVAILLPTAQSGDSGVISGDNEQAKFDSLATVAVEDRTALANILTSRLAPAIQDADFAAFCAAMEQYNRQSGELFTAVQGGAYNGAATTRLISQLRTAGFTGVGQSSWGPGVFAWHPDEVAAANFQRGWSKPELSVFVARTQSHGRTVETRW